MTDPGASTHAATAVRIRPTEMASRRAGDEIVVLDLIGSAYHALNDSGALLWEAMTGWTTLDELAAMLVGSFGCTLEVAAADVERFVGQCAAAGVIEIRPELKDGHP